MFKIEIASNVTGTVEYEWVEVATEAEVDAIYAGLAEHQWVSDEWFVWN